MTRKLPPSLVAAFGLSLALAATAPAAEILRTPVSAPQSQWRACHERLAAGQPGVVTRAARANQSGLLSATLRGGHGDWDVAVFDARTGHAVAGSAAPRTRELAQGYVVEGEELVVQACRVDGDGGTPRLSVAVTPFAGAGPAMRPKLIRVKTRNTAQRNDLARQGFDLDEGRHRDGSISLVVRTEQELDRLRRTGYGMDTVIDDLLAHDLEKGRRDAQFAAEARERDRHGDTGLPSGRTSYRHLADYELELKQLALQHPGLVKLVELPHKSLLGRPVLGVEITSNVNVADGKPTFLQLGVHHAREWPAGEMPMEWAHQLVTRYGKDPRTTRLVDQARTIVVPIVNPDGFTMSREAPYDFGTPFNLVGRPEAAEQFGGALSTAYGVALSSDPGHAYKRKNCRLQDGQVPTAEACEAADSSIGVDPNRNYGGFWGGGGASSSIDDETYRGAGPFSEPEVENVRRLVSTRQIHTLITNHTFTGLVLRPPGIKAQGAPPDEEIYKALGDGMAAQNGYISQKSFELYDTTGTTEDWSYYATGGFGFTFEIGFTEFHPEFQRGVVDEWQGTGERAGKGNREAYYIALEHTAESRHHSVLSGKAPAGSVLRLHKAFMSHTSGVVDQEGVPGERIAFEDVLDTTLPAGDGGAFEWHVNPSTRPLRKRDQKFILVDKTPRRTLDIANATPTGGAPGVGSEEVEFEVKPDEPRNVLQVRVEMGTEQDDYDLVLYKDQVDDEHQVGSSGGAAGAIENIVIPDPEPGKYILVVNNYAAAGGWHGKVNLYGAAAERIDPAATESWTLTCERPAGTVVATRDVVIERGQRLDLGNACARSAARPAAGAGKLRLRLAVDRRRLRRALASGLRARMRCSLRCRTTLRLTVDGRAARRLGLARSSRSAVVVGRSRAVTFTGRRTVTVRFTRRAARALSRARTVRLSLIGTATSKGRRRETASVRFALRR